MLCCGYVYFNFKWSTIRSHDKLFNSHIHDHFLQLKNKTVTYLKSMEFSWIPTSFPSYFRSSKHEASNRTILLLYNYIPILSSIQTYVELYRLRLWKCCFLFLFWLLNEKTLINAVLDLYFLLVISYECIICWKFVLTAALSLFWFKDMSEKLFPEQDTGNSGQFPRLKEQEQISTQ